MDGQGTKCRRNIAENYNRLSRVQERYRQTDRRQTDGRATAYSEREREFTFANKIISDPSCRRRSAVLKLFYFTRGSIMKWNKIIFWKIGGVQLSLKWVCVIVTSIFCLLFGCSLILYNKSFITTSEYHVTRQMLWLAATTLPYEYSNMTWVQNYFISFHMRFHVKIEFCKIILFHFTRGLC